MRCCGRNLRVESALPQVVGLRACPLLGKTGRQFGRMIQRIMPFFRLLVLILVLALPVGASAQTIPGLSLTPQPADTTSTAAPATSPEAAKALIDILKDDAARAALIGELEKLAQPDAGAAAASSGDAAETEATDAPTVPLAREIGSVTQDLSRQVVEVVLKIGRGLGNLTRLFDGSAAVNWEGVQEQGLALAILIVFAFATLTVARFIARFPLGAVERAARNKPLPRRVVWSGLALLIDWAVIGLAWFGTSAYAIAASGGGRMDLMQSLFIDAFVLIEFLKSCLASILQYRRPALKVVNLEPATARFWYLWLSRLISFSWLWRAGGPSAGQQGDRLFGGYRLPPRRRSDHAHRRHDPGVGEAGRSEERPVPPDRAGEEFRPAHDPGASHPRLERHRHRLSGGGLRPLGEPAVRRRGLYGLGDGRDGLRHHRRRSRRQPAVPMPSPAAFACRPTSRRRCPSWKRGST